MNNDKVQFQKEQDDLLKFILTERFFNPWLDYKNKDFDLQKSLYKESKLELFLTSSCNQHCEYCYLVRHPELYPNKYNNKDLILNNLKILLDWIISKDFHIFSYDIFTGEIWHTDFGLEVLEILYKYITEKGLFTKSISIPSNVSFLSDKVQTAKIQNYIDKFKREGVYLIFSISVDGEPIESFSRPLNSSIVKNKEFYESMFMFAKHNTYYFHPMVSATNVKYWIENHKWWTAECKKYDLDVDEVLMMLEVRNNDWDEESINYYNEFLNYIIDTQIERQKSVKNFALSLFGLIKSYQTGYVPYSPALSDTFLGCSVNDCLTVRLGDLAICPCHRTAYKKLLYGKFVLENNEIVDIESNNVGMATKILISNSNLTSFKCDCCIYNKYCLSGCYGSQYETMNDPFMPIPSVCKFFEEKWKNIVKKFKQEGVIEYLKLIPNTSIAYLEVKEFLKFVKEVEQDVG